MRRISKSDPVFVVVLTDDAVTVLFGTYVKFPLLFVFTLILWSEGALIFCSVKASTVVSPVKVTVASPETFDPPSIVIVVPLIDTDISSVISTILGSSMSSVINAGISMKRIYIEGDFVYHGIVPVTVFFVLIWSPFASTAYATTVIDADADRPWATASVPTGVVCSDPPFIVYLTCVILVPESCWAVNVTFVESNEAPVTLGIFLPVPPDFIRTIPEPPLEPSLFSPSLVPPPPPPVCLSASPLEIPSSPPLAPPPLPPLPVESELPDCPHPPPPPAKYPSSPYNIPYTADKSFPIPPSPPLPLYSLVAFAPGNIAPPPPPPP